MRRMSQDRAGAGQPAGRRLGGAAAMLGALALLGGCETVQSAVSTPADSYANAGGIFSPAWGGNRPEMLDSSMTVARLTNATGSTGTLMPEPGDVWPGPLPPRTTLANPDAALRGIPDFEPSPRAPMPPPPDLSVPPRSSSTRGLPPGLRGSASPPPPPVERTPLPRGQAALPRPAPLPGGPPPRADGQVVLTPNGPVVTSGGTDRVQSYVGSDGQTGVVVRDGNTTTVIPQGGVPQPGTPAR